jgi:hypothetical protein
MSSDGGAFCHFKIGRAKCISKAVLDQVWRRGVFDLVWIEYDGGIDLNCLDVPQRSGGFRGRVLRLNVMTYQSQTQSDCDVNKSAFHGSPSICEFVRNTLFQ